MILNDVDDDIGKWLLFSINVWDDEEYCCWLYFIDVEYSAR
jgi:hypothetical protein